MKTTRRYFLKVLGLASSALSTMGFTSVAKRIKRPVYTVFAAPDGGRFSGPQVQPCFSIYRDRSVKWHSEGAQKLYEPSITAAQCMTEQPRATERVYGKRPRLDDADFYYNLDACRRKDQKRRQEVLKDVIRRRLDESFNGPIPGITRI